MKKVGIFSIVISLAIHASAGWSPIGFGIVGVGDGQFPESDDSVYGLNIGILHSELKAMRGLSVAGAVLSVREASGVSFSGLSSGADKTDGGLMQVAGLINVVKEHGEGVQIAGLCNNARNYTGAQMAFANVLEGPSNQGAQFGAINFATEGFSGLQVGAINMAGDAGGGDMAGVQVGAVNCVNGGFRGVQVGAFNYVNGNFSGVQIGAINVVASSDVMMLPILRVAF